MPGFDGTGPQGMGPRTGRGMGPCGGGYGYGGGFGRGFGRRGGGFGWRRFASPKNELQDLEAEEKILEEELAAIREQKASLESEQK